MPTRVAPSRTQRERQEEDNEVEEEEDVEMGEEQLQFSEALSWQAGRAIPAAELLRRLESLGNELKDTEQGTIAKSSLHKPAQELVHSNLVKHKDKGVKAWTAHCLVDILRLAAPNAPFSGPQLKDVFNLFISYSIGSLADSNDAYHSQHYHVLQVLVTTKASVLMTDIPSSSNLMISAFDTAFDLLSQTSHAISKNVEYHLTGLLQSLIEEGTLPTEAVDITLAQFMRAGSKTSSRSSVFKGKRTGQKEDLQPGQTRIHPKEMPPAYGVAQSICNTCLDRMARHIGQYFSNVIIDATGSSPSTSKHKSKRRAHEDSDDDPDDRQPGPKLEDLEQLRKAHLLLRELWKSCPGLLHNVIPQIESELSADNAAFRLLATEALGDMSAGIGVEACLPAQSLDPAIYPQEPIETSSQDKGGEDAPQEPKASQSLAQTHVAAYQNFLGRRNDRAPEVRAAWAMGAARIISTSAGGLGIGGSQQSDLIEHLSQLLVDHEEKVRLATVQALGCISISDFVTKIGSVPASTKPSGLMARLSDRMKEISPLVRSEAAHLLGRLWGVVAGQAEETEQAQSLFEALPSRILNAAYANRTDINVLIDKVIFESLVPLGYPVVKKKDKAGLAKGHKPDDGVVSTTTEADPDRLRVERLLQLLKGLDDKAKHVMLSIMVRPIKMAKVVKSFVHACEEFNGGVIDQKDKETRSQLSKLIDHIAASLPEPGRISEDLWRFAKSHDRRAYALIKFCIADDSDYRKIHKSIKELAKKLPDVSHASPTLPDTVMTILYRASHLFYNKSHLRPIIEITSNEKHPLSEPAHELLKEISQRAPGVFKAHGQELCDLVATSAPSASRSNDTGALDALKACAAFARRYPKDVPQEKSFHQAMLRYVQRGSPPSAAKYATSILLWSSEKREMHSKELWKQCVKGFESGDDYYVSSLAAMSQLMLLQADQMDEETEIEPILQIAIEDVLKRKVNELADSQDPDAGRVEQDAKCWALKILVNRLRSYPDAETVKEIAPQVIRLLNKNMTTDPDPASSSHEQAMTNRLRLQSALCLLKLSSHSDFGDRLVSPQLFTNLMLLAQDGSQHTRHTFVKKLQKYLGQDRLPSRFYTITFLLAFEPVRGFKQDCSIWLRARASMFSKANKATLELNFARFLSALAHHPDFSRDMADVGELVTYILFYLQNVATEKNTSVIYHIAQRVKTVRDGVTAAGSSEVNNKKNEDLYYLSDLSARIINVYATLHSWQLRAVDDKDKVRLPSGIFALMRGQSEAQEVAGTSYLGEEASEEVEAEIRRQLKKGKNEKKRKSDGEEGGRASKRRDTSVALVEGVATGNAKTAAARTRVVRTVKKTVSKTPGKSRAKSVEDEDEESDAAPKRLKPESADRRKSARSRNSKSYAEADESSDDLEMEAWQHGDDAVEEGNSIGSRGSEKENKRVVAA